MTGSGANDGIRPPAHPRTANINDGIFHTKVETRLATKGERITAILDSALHPNNTLCTSVCFQRRKGRGVRAKELTGERVVPVQDDHTILAEVESSQLSWTKHRVSVPGSGDSVLNHSIAPWIVCLEDCVVVRSTHARVESIINDVAGNKLVTIWLKTDRQPIADQEPASRCRARGRGRGAR